MDKQQKIMIAVLSVLLAILIVITCVLFTGKRETVIGEFKAPPFEQGAVAGIPQVSREHNYKTVEVTDGFSFAMCGNLALINGGCVLYFTSPEANTVWLRVRIYDTQDKLLGQSGILRPGQYLEAVRLTQSISSSIPVKIKVMAYEPETYFSKGSISATLTLNVTE